MAGTSFAHARLAAVVVLLFGFLPNPSLSAQVATGSIVGTVRDASGEIVPGAQVTIREVNRNTFLETEGAHHWRIWRRYLRDLAPLLFR